MIEKYLNRGVYIVALCSLLVLLVMICWAFWPYKTLEMFTPIKILNPNKTVANGVLEYESDYKKFTNKSCTVSRVIIQQKGAIKTIYVLPTYISNVAAGSAIVPMGLMLPTNMQNGDNYRMIITFTYKANYLRTIELGFYSELFSIRNNP